MMNTEGET